MADYFSQLSRPTVNNTNNNNNNNNIGVVNRSVGLNNNNNNNNQQQQQQGPLPQSTFSTLGNPFGLHTLPSNIKVVEVEADLSQLRVVDSSCQISVSNIIEYISYEVATDKKDVNIHIYVGESAYNDDTIYNIACTFDSTTEFKISRITDILRSFDPHRMYEDIILYHDTTTLKHTLVIPFHKNPMLVSHGTRTTLHYTAKPAIHTYDTGRDDNKRESVKRKFNHISS